MLKPVNMNRQTPWYDRILVSPVCLLIFKHPLSLQDTSFVNIHLVDSATALIRSALLWCKSA